MRRRALLAVAGTLLAMPSVAQADSQLTVSGGQLLFASEDAAVANRLTVEAATRSGQPAVRFADDADAAGISTYPTDRCTPGRVNGRGNPVEVTCSRAGLTGVSLDLGPAEDRAASGLGDLPVSVAGNVGADALTTGAADDLLSGDQGDDLLTGGDGADQLVGGEGADVLDGGGGDDRLEAADGFADRVVCGAGTDTVQADTFDEVVDCEQVERRDVAPPAGAATAADRTAPRLQAGALTSQRLTAKARTVRVTATSSERGLVQVTGFLDAGGLNDRLAPATATVAVAGGGVTVRLALTRAQRARVARDLRRRRRPAVVLTVTSVDAAGNTSRPRRFTVRLR